MCATQEESKPSAANRMAVLVLGAKDGAKPASGSYPGLFVFGVDYSHSQETDWLTGAARCKPPRPPGWSQDWSADLTSDDSEVWKMMIKHL